MNLATGFNRGALLAVLVGLATGGTTQTPAQTADEPRAVRNDVFRAGQEVLVLRHQKLKKGSHRRFYELSRDGVWPWFEKIGTRIVGQWQVVYPQGGGSEEYDEGYRLARYRSYNHWQATRRGIPLGGNGPDYHKNVESLRARTELRLGSDGAIFLQGYMAPGGPYYLPGLDESYRRVGTSGSASEPEVSPKEPFPVRNDVARKGEEEIVTLRYWRIKKGTFEEFYRLSRDGVWPYFEKIGARVVGQWRVIHPPASTGRASEDYDEVYMLTRYAGYEHWQATRPAVHVKLGGNGPDYESCRDAIQRRREMSLSTSLVFLQGYFHHSPPVFLPGLGETYRRDEGDEP